MAQVLLILACTYGVIAVGTFAFLLSVFFQASRAGIMPWYMVLPLALWGGLLWWMLL
jgi:hypothetical protein